MKQQYLLCVAVISLCIAAVSCKKNEGEFPPPEPPRPDTLSAGWSKQAVSAFPINDVVFFNNSNGFAIDQQSSIFRSTDGGQLWQKIYTAQQGYVNISMGSPTHAIFINRNGKVLVTRNGGASFDSVTISDPSLVDVHCFNSNSAVAVGRYCWKTTDGGTTWIQVADLNSLAESVSFSDALNGWVGGNFGLKKSTDGGLSWQPVTIPPGIGSPLYTVQSLSSSNLFFTTNILAAKSVNGGTSWTPVHNLETNTYHDVHFIDANNGYLTDGRYLLKTTDGGGSWNILLRLGGTYLLEVHFTDLNHGWAGSGDGAIYRFLQ